MYIHCEQQNFTYTVNSCGGLHKDYLMPEILEKLMIFPNLLILLPFGEWG